MSSLDFLVKLYKTSSSAVVIVNTTNTICWSSNLFKIGVYEEDIRGELSEQYFGKNICELYPGEYVAKINGNSYTYNVKTFADRTNEFVIVEIRTVTLGASIVQDDAICDLLSENQNLVKDSACNIMSIVDNLQMQKSRISKNDYTRVLQCVKNIMNSNRSLFNIIETRHECENDFDEINLSEFIQNLATTCKSFFDSKKVDIVINCTEEISCFMGPISFENLCLSCISRVVSICEGYIDNLIIGLEMVSDTKAELYISTECPSGKAKVSDFTEIKKQIDKDDIMGTDIFYIRYFCEMFSAEATQKIERDIHKATVSVQIPRCSTSGIMLFRCSETFPEDYNRFSKASLCLEKVSSCLEDNPKK